MNTPSERSAEKTARDIVQITKDAGLGFYYDHQAVRDLSLSYLDLLKRHEELIEKACTCPTRYRGFACQTCKEYRALSPQPPLADAEEK